MSNILNLKFQIKQLIEKLKEIKNTSNHSSISIDDKTVIEDNKNKINILEQQITNLDTIVNINTSDISLLKNNVTNIYARQNLPLNSADGVNVLVTDGTVDNKQTMAYSYQNKWYRTFDNSLISNQTIHLFILAGQSNAHGHANVSALDSSKHMQNGLFYTSWHENTSNAESKQYFTDWMSSLNAGSTRGSGTSSELSGSNFFGPELGFANQASTINLTGENKLGIIKYAVGASTLNAGTNLSDWDTSVSGENEGDCWRGFQIALNDAIAKLNNAGYSWEFKGMIWWQGESGSSVAGLQTFISEVRTLLGSTYGVENSSQFPVVITKIGYNTDLTPVATADAYIDIVDAGAFGHSSANNHIGTSSNKDTNGNGTNDMFDIGQEYANKMQLAMAGTTSGSWSPSLISTLLWLDYNDQTTFTLDPNGYVSKVSDKSGNGYDFTSYSGSTLEIKNNEQNGKSVLRFENNTDYFNGRSVNFSTNTRHKWFFVLKTRNIDNNLDNWVTVTGNIGGQTRQLILMGLSGQGEFRGKWYVHNDSNLTTSSSNIIDEWNILSVEWDEPNAQASTWLNGELFDNKKNVPNAILGANMNVRFNKYQKTGDSDWGEAIFAENVTNENSQKIEGYLAHKWGLQHKLPQTHPYKLFSP